MAVQLDPEQNEFSGLQDLLGDLSDKSLLEIGCGDGRLTWRYAPAARQVTALDPKEDRIAKARADCPRSLKSNVSFHCLNLEQFYEQFVATKRYDLALNSWSL